MVAACGSEMTGPTIGVVRTMRMALSGEIFFRCWVDGRDTSSDACMDKGRACNEATDQAKPVRTPLDRKTRSDLDMDAELALGTIGCVILPCDTKPSGTKHLARKDRENLGASGQHRRPDMFEHPQGSPVTAQQDLWPQSGFSVGVSVPGPLGNWSLREMESMHLNVSRHVISGSDEEAPRVTPSAQFGTRSGRMVQQDHWMHFSGMEMPFMAEPEMPAGPDASTVPRDDEPIQMTLRVSGSEMTQEDRSFTSRMPVIHSEQSLARTRHIATSEIRDADSVRLASQRVAGVPVDLSRAMLPHLGDTNTRLQQEVAHEDARDAAHRLQIVGLSNVEAAQHRTRAPMLQDHGAASHLDHPPDTRVLLGPIPEQTDLTWAMRDLTTGLVPERKAQDLGIWPRPISTARLQADIPAPLVRLAAARGSAVMQVTLDPIELGRVRIAFHPAETGLMVQISAERPEALELMRRHVDVLTRELSQMGFEDVAMQFSEDAQNGGSLLAGAPHQKPQRESVVPQVEETRLQELPLQQHEPASTRRVDMRI